MANIGVIGAGSWGTALAILLCNNGHNVTIWSYQKAEADMLDKEREHKTKLPGVKLPDELKITSDLTEVTNNKDVIVLAVPSKAVRQNARNLSSLLPKGQIIVDVAKGFEEDTLMTLSEQISEEIPAANVAVLSGPSHAEEVAREMPTSVVIGAKDRKTAEYLQNIFMSNAFRVYTSPDIVGIEVGGALKNVIALAAGMADGLGYGDNAKAALITRGIHEISQLGFKMGGDIETFGGLTGVGDLIVTCESKHSRNRKAGYLIGKGYTYKEAMEEVQMVVEGVYSAKAAVGLANKYNVDLPIVSEVNKILFENKNAREAVNSLMQRDKKPEHMTKQWD